MKWKLAKNSHNIIKHRTIRFDRNGFFG